MSTISYERAMREKNWIERQTDAEFAFAKSLEDQGVDPVQFMKQWKLSLHEFNTLAHYIYGVHDEQPVLPPALKALLQAMETRLAAA